MLPFDSSLSVFNVSNHNFKLKKYGKYSFNNHQDILRIYIRNWKKIKILVLISEFLVSIMCDGVVVLVVQGNQAQK